MVAQYLENENIPFETKWVEYPDVAALCIKLKAEPTAVESDGSPHYTLPVIYDPETGRAVSESLEIAVYLDKQFPDTPRLMPEGTYAFHWAFARTYENTILDDLWTFALPQTLVILNPASQGYFRRTREEQYGGIRMEDLVPVGEAREKQWNGLKNGLSVLDGWYKKQEAHSGKGPFLMGEKPGFCDFSVAGFTIWLKLIWGEDSVEWKDIRSWHDGRWAKVVEDFKPYERI